MVHCLWSLGVPIDPAGQEDDTSPSLQRVLLVGLGQAVEDDQDGGLVKAVVPIIDQLLIPGAKAYVPAELPEVERIGQVLFDKQDPVGSLTSKSDPKVGKKDLVYHNTMMPESKVVNASTTRLTGDVTDGSNESGLLFGLNTIGKKDAGLGAKLLAIATAQQYQERRAHFRCRTDPDDARSRKRGELGKHGQDLERTFDWNVTGVVTRSKIEQQIHSSKVAIFKEIVFLIFLALVLAYLAFILAPANGFFAFIATLTPTALFSAGICFMTIWGFTSRLAKIRQKIEQLKKYRNTLDGLSPEVAKRKAEELKTPSLARLRARELNSRARIVRAAQLAVSNESANRRGCTIENLANNQTQARRAKFSAKRIGSFPSMSHADSEFSRLK